MPQKPQAPNYIYETCLRIEALNTLETHLKVRAREMDSRGNSSGMPPAPTGEFASATVCVLRRWFPLRLACSGVIPILLPAAIVHALPLLWPSRNRAIPRCFN